MRLMMAIATLALCLAGAARSAAAQPPATTRQMVLERNEAGRYAWKLVRVAVPAVGDHEVLVHMRAVSLQRGDIEIVDALSAASATGRDHTGQIVCSDGAGDVVAIGKLVRGVRVGSRVTSLYFSDYLDEPLSAEKQAKGHGYTVNGVLGDYVVLEDTGIAPMVAGLTFEEAATLPTAALTAWMATAGGGLVRRDDVALIQGTGGISTFALQFSAASGARVIVTSSSDEKLRRARALGARDGINYKDTPAWSDRVMALTGGRGADLVVDIGGKATLGQSMKSLAYGGTISLVGGLSGYGADVAADDLIHKAARAQGIYAGSRADYLRMSAFIKKHRIHPAIERTYPLDRYEEALKDLAAGNFVGKLVIRL